MLDDDHIRLQDHDDPNFSESFQEKSIYFGSNDDVTRTRDQKRFRRVVFDVNHRITLRSETMIVSHVSKSPDIRSRRHATVESSLSKSGNFFE